MPTHKNQRKNNAQKPTLWWFENGRRSSPSNSLSAPLSLPGALYTNKPGVIARV